jgi:hypothetical protein
MKLIFCSAKGRSVGLLGSRLYGVQAKGVVVKSAKDHGYGGEMAMRAKFTHCNNVCCSTCDNPSKTPSLRGILWWAKLQRLSGTASVKVSYREPEVATVVVDDETQSVLREVLLSPAISCSGVEFIGIVLWISTIPFPLTVALAVLKSFQISRVPFNNSARDASRMNQFLSISSKGAADCSRSVFNEGILSNL